MAKQTFKTSYKQTHYFYDVPESLEADDIKGDEEEEEEIEE